MKVILLGLSGTGKTTIGNQLKERYGFPVLEADDEALRRYNGIWLDDEALIDASFEETNRRVLTMSHVFFITTWLEKEMIEAFYAAGFHLIRLLAPLDELLRRRRLRDGKFKADILQRVKHNYQAFLDIVQEPDIAALFSLKLDMSQISTDEAIGRILDVMRGKDF